MESKGVIFEGKTLDDAVKKGLEALGLSRAEVMIQVMEEGSSGFLGLGSRPYKVRMMPRPRREMSDRTERRPGRDRERSGRGGRDRAERGGRGERGGERGDRRARGERPDRGPRAERGGRPERGPRPERPARSPERVDPMPGAGAFREEPAIADSRRDEGAGGEGPRRRRRRRSGGRNGAEGPSERAPRADHGPRPAMEDRPETVREPREGNGPLMPAEELVATSKRLAEDLFRAMGFEAQVSAHADGDSVEVKAEIGEDSELITGEKGEVRQSIQHLLNRMLNRGATHYHLQLEINDFWARRESELQEMARRLAEEAVADQAEKLTEYLNAQERRVVHVALRDDSRVRTFGLGDGLIKKVAIAPAGPEDELKPDQ